MAAGSHNFKIEQGADFNNTITYEDASGNKINLSGAAITLKAKDNRSDTNFVINLSVGNGITLSNPSRVKSASFWSRSMTIPVAVSVRLMFEIAISLPYG